MLFHKFVAARITIDSVATHWRSKQYEDGCRYVTDKSAWQIRRYHTLAFGQDCKLDLSDYMAYYPTYHTLFSRPGGRVPLGINFIGAFGSAVTTGRENAI